MTLRFLSLSGLTVLLTASILSSRAIATSNYQPSSLTPQEQQALQQIEPLLRTAGTIEQVPSLPINKIQSQLKQMKHTVMLYALTTDDKLHLVLVTPDRAVTRTVSVSKQDLDRDILAFRAALQSPNSDAKSIGQKLYGHLIQPIEKDLSDAKAQTILYSPDRTLRYIPLAALHDGEQWLVERFGVNNITSFDLTNFDTNRQPLKILAGASTQGMVVQVGGRTERFPPMLFTKPEVEAISKTVPNTTVLVDQALSKEALFTQMQNHNIIHLATNARFFPGNPDESLILLGDGYPVTFKDLQTWKLANVDLLVLSSCDTALGGITGDGTEIMGFAYTAQKAGAKAVMGSLWVVDDRGTQILMSQFYRSLAQGTTKTDSLRQAQLAMIHSDSDRAKGGVTIKPTQSNRQWSHPFYWASFVLIGNGL